jgi:hypothetical protein
VRYANSLLRDKVLFGSDFPAITPDDSRHRRVRHSADRRRRRGGSAHPGGAGRGRCPGCPRRHNSPGEWRPCVYHVLPERRPAWRHKGISGSFTLTITGNEVDAKPGCQPFSGSALLAQSIFIAGSGAVSLP